MKRLLFAGFSCLSTIAVLLLASCAHSSHVTTPESRPVLWYCLYFNAPGENRYAPDGAYSEVLNRLRSTFDLRISDERPTREMLRGVNVLLIANPNESAFGTNIPPLHVQSADIKALRAYVDEGGGLVVMGNQENHNLEIDDLNRLLAHWGLKFVNRYTDPKLLVIPKEVPVIGGLRWAYVAGNQIVVAKGDPSRPQAWVVNDLTQKPEKGTRNEPGILMARAMPGEGRVVVVTDSGWIINNALMQGPVAGDIVFRNQDNFEIFQRILNWAAGQP